MCSWPHGAGALFSSATLTPREWGRKGCWVFLASGQRVSLARAGTEGCVGTTERHRRSLPRESGDGRDIVIT